jgi:glycerol-3-phosphate acyltransferase PlsY
VDLLPAILIGYLVGSLPIGYLLTQGTRGIDLRRVGSGNVGAANAHRTSGLGIAIGVMLADAGKGAAAVLLGGGGAGSIAPLAAGVAAVVGHVYPVWLGFRGGKGVATALGILLALSPEVGVLACVTWALSGALTRYSSVAALTALALAPVYAYFLAPPQIKEAAIALAVIVWLRHIGNIRRLFAGTEPRIGQPAIH